MLGKKGDWYFFFNDTWHGRQPNLHGKQLITVRFGGFATDFEFPEDIPVPRFPSHVSQAYRDRYRADQPRNTDPTSILQQMAANHRRPQLNMFGLAKTEKQLGAALSKAIMERWPEYCEEKYQATPK